MKDNNLLSNEIENIQKEYNKLKFEETVIVNEEQYVINNIQEENNIQEKNNKYEDINVDIVLNNEIKNYIYELINLIDNKII